MRPAVARLSALALFLGAACVGCEDHPPKPAQGGPPPTPPPREAPTGVAPVPAPPTPGGPVQSLQMTQIMVVYRSKARPTWPRTKEEALAFAQELVRQVEGGTPIEKLVYAHTDDRGDDGQPFNRGSYSLDPRDRRTQAGLIAAVQATPVGSLAKEPYDSGLAYIVFRRDR